MPYKDINKRRAANRYSYSKNKEKRLKDGKLYYAENVEKESKRKRKAYVADTRRWLFWSARRRAKVSGLQCDISYVDIPEIPKVCPILGIELKVNGGSCGPKINSPTLDRIDNTKGYIIGNLAIISWKANSHKGDLTVSQVENLLRYMNQGPNPQKAIMEYEDPPQS